MSDEPTPPPSRSERTRAKRAARRRATSLVAAGVVTIGLIAAISFFVVHRSNATASTSRPPSSTTRSAPASSTTSPSTTTTSTTQPPGPGFTAGKVTAIGDSVMIDYQDELAKAIPGITIDAAVSRQWYEGEAILMQMKAAGTLGATVIVGLATNGPLTSSDIDHMMTTLAGASHVIFINTHVDQPWQTPNNQMLAASATRYKNVSVVDWYSLANENPSWFGPDQTHLAINGGGTAPLAAAIAAQVTG